MMAVSKRLSDIEELERVETEEQAQAIAKIIVINVG